jgi:predicted nucleic acid-binding protein
MLSGLEKAGRRVEIRDVSVETTALQESYAVATENKEHFQRIPNLSPHPNKNYYGDSTG